MAKTYSTTAKVGPKPDWGRRGTQPKTPVGPKPKPNGQLVATKPVASQASQPSS
jgi:hypothetical protein